MVPPLMSRRFGYSARWLALVVLVGAAPATLRAQGMSGPGMNVGNMQSMPAMGNLATPSGSLFGGGSQPGKDEDPALNITDSYVSFIDSAVPRNLIGLRFEAAYQN